MFKIPHLTAPETKFIRTLEGVLIALLNIVIIVATIVSHIVSGVHGIDPNVAMAVLGVTNSVAAFSRSALKAVMTTQQGLGLPTPAQIFDPTALADAEKLAGEITDPAAPSGVGKVNVAASEQAAGNPAFSSAEPPVV